MALLLALMMVVGLLPALSLPARAATNGNCGAATNPGGESSVTWSLNSGVLTITGTGAMANWEPNDVPWNSSRNLITSVVIKDGVTTIGEHAFFYCSKLTSITLPGSLTAIGDSAFSNCKELTSITVPKGVTSIGSNPFSSCSALTEIIVDGENPAYTAVDGVLFNKAKTELLRYPRGKANTSYEIPGGVTTIRDWAFSSCSKLTSITLPGSLTAIGDSAFSSCKELTSITFPDSLTTIGDSAFSYCSKLTSIAIPEGVTTIGERAFHNCVGLTSITLPDSLTTIGGYAFEYCSGLKSITLPKGVTSISSRPFQCCSALTEIIVDEENPAYTAVDGVLFNKAKTELLCYPEGKNNTSYVIPSGVTTIGNDAFHFCKGLTSITVPEGVTTIGDYAFDNCVGLTSITFPDSLTTIGDSAFYYCSGLKSITLPDSLTTIGDSAFYDCKGLTSITIPEGVTTIGDHAFGVSEIYSILEGDLELTFVGDAPTFWGHPFSCLTATAYYPAGNATWTADVLQDYGGETIWVPYCEHSYEPVINPPTCNTAGDTIYTCTKCGDSYTESIAATGHKYSGGVCTVCGAVEPGHYFVAGSFNGWKEALPDYIMTADEDGIYHLDIQVEAGENSLKVTDGSWDNWWGGSGEYGNYEFYVTEAGTITVTFDPVTRTVAVTGDIISEMPSKPEQPSRVEGVTVSDLGRTGFHVSWDAINGATRYWVYLNGKLYNSATGNSLAVINRKMETDYQVSVTALLADGTILDLAEADMVSVTTLGYAFNSSYSASPNSITLSWDVDGCTKTWVYVGTSPEDMKIKGSSVGTAHTVVGLEENTTYYVKLTHLIDGKIVSSNEILEITTQARSFTSTYTARFDSIGLTWNVEGATKSWIYFGTDPDNLKLTASSTTGSYTVKKLADGVTYYYMLTHLIDGKIVSSNEIVEVTTPVNEALVATMSVTDGIAHFTWNAVGDSYKYWVIVKTSEKTIVRSTTNLSYTLSGIDFENCEITVRGINSDGIYDYTLTED